MTAVEVMFLALSYMRTSECEVTVTDILDSDHLPVISSILDPVTSEASESVGELTHLASEFVSPDIQINPSNEADKATRDFEISII